MRTESQSFTVITKDWYGLAAEYAVTSISTVLAEGGRVSVVFRNSRGDTEKKLVAPDYVFFGGRPIA